MRGMGENKRDRSKHDGCEIIRGMGGNERDGKMRWPCTGDEN